MTASSPGCGDDTEHIPVQHFTQTQRSIASRPLSRWHGACFYKTTMNMNKSLVLAFAATMLVGSLAHADVILVAGTSGVGGAADFSNKVNFDDLTLGNAAQSTGGITVSFTGNAAVVNGSQSGVYAAPFLSGANGIGFGSPDQLPVPGQDATNYLTTGTGTVTLYFGGALQHSFGLLWGSVDNYNTLEFKKGGAVVTSFIGSQVLAAANGSQQADGTVYANFTSVNGFDTVVARSTSNAFEFDNVSYSTQQISVPDGGLTLALLGLGLSGLGLIRRRF